MSIIGIDSELISCSICSVMYSLRKNNLPFALSCGHSYCKDCLDKLKKDSSIICPIDKKKIPVLLGINLSKSQCKNIDIIKFLILCKVTKKRNLQAFHKLSYKYCEDCGISLSTLNWSKHLFMNHNLLNLNALHSKHFDNKAGQEGNLEDHIRKYYYTSRYFYTHKFWFFDVKDLDVEEYIIKENHFFVSFNIRRDKNYFEAIFEDTDKNTNRVRFGYLFKNDITIIGLFEFNNDNNIINAFGLCIKKYESIKKGYFLGYMNFNKETLMDFGIYVNDSVRMYGKFDPDDSSHLLYGEIINSEKKKIHILPFKKANEHKFLELSDNGIRVQKEEIIKNLEIKFYITYIFSLKNNVTEIMIEKGCKTVLPYCRIFSLNDELGNIKIYDVPLEFSFFGRGKIIIKFSQTCSDICVIFNNNYGLLIQPVITINKDKKLLEEIETLKSYCLSQIYYKFSSILQSFSIIFETILDNFTLSYKYFNDFDDRNIDFSKENYIFDLQKNTVKTTQINQEKIISYTLKHKTLEQLINNIFIDINEVSNLYIKDKLSSPTQNMRNKDTAIVKIKTKEVYCKCIIF